MSESGNQDRIRAHYTGTLGARLFRNNVGVLLDKTGRPVRYGLGNDSKAMNETIKSGDLIGWTPRLVTPDMVGSVVAEFLSVEVKADGWKFPRPGPTHDAKGRLTAYGHALAQLRWAQMVRAEGGTAGFMIDPERGFEPY